MYIKEYICLTIIIIIIFYFKCLTLGTTTNIQWYILSYSGIGILIFCLFVCFLCFCFRCCAFIYIYTTKGLEAIKSGWLLTKWLLNVSIVHIRYYNNHRLENISHVTVIQTACGYKQDNYEVVKYRWLLQMDIHMVPSVLLCFTHTLS